MEKVQYLGYHDHSMGNENCPVCKHQHAEYVTREEYFTSQRNIRIIQWLTVASLLTGFLLNMRSLFSEKKARRSLPDSE